jgi:hypothetical protein
MKLSEIFGYIIIAIVIAFVLRELFPKREVETIVEYVYLPGKIDTISTKDTVYLDKPIYIPSDTVEIDSNGSKSFSTAFSIEVDSSVGVKGKVGFKEPLFSFEDIEIWYPKVTITKVDTLLKTVTNVVEPYFYENTWFWTTVGAVAVLILTLTGR